MKMINCMKMAICGIRKVRATALMSGLASLVLAVFAVTTNGLADESLPWPKPDKVVRLWPGDAPGLVPGGKAENIARARISNISVPELWAYLPKTPDQHRAALMICPGGGYSFLDMNTHVGKVVKLFNDQGVAVFAMKYRTRYGANKVADDAVADCARGVRLIRQNAAEWGIDPARVGVQGYSAGGNVCLNLLGRFDAGNAKATDPVEKQSSRPDFMALMCPWPNGKAITSYPVLTNPPPVFVASARDDKTASTAFAEEIAEAVKKQGGQVQLFLVPTGGHSAFHYGAGDGPGTKWPDALMPMIQHGTLSASEKVPSTEFVKPGEVWPDDRGQHIQAHGGGITKVGDTYYWFGEDFSRDNDPNKRFVVCYASKDLVRWTFRNQVIKLADPENFGPKWLIERPKVYYNAKTKKYVMYMHIDRWYKLARVGVATCDTIDGDYKYLRSFRPLGKESRDIGQFVDDDGSAYLIFECRPEKGFYIAKLSDDYLDVEKAVSFIKAPLEGGGVVHYQGLYYVIGSKLTSWDPNPNVFATAPSIAGPWSEFKDIAPPERKTYGSQSSMLLKVTGTKATTVIFIGDIWKPKTQWDSRYLLMPLEIGDGKLWLPEPRPWRIDVQTGEVTIKPE